MEVNSWGSNLKNTSKISNKHMSYPELLSIVHNIHNKEI